MSRNADPTGKTPAKKPYQEPQLVIYGDIHEITQATTFPVGNLDGVRTFQTGGRV